MVNDNNYYTLFEEELGKKIRRKTSRQFKKDARKKQENGKPWYLHDEVGYKMRNKAYLNQKAKIMKVVVQEELDDWLASLLKD